MRTMHIDNERLGVVMLREAFAPGQADANGTPLVDGATGELVYHARVLIPGGADGGFGHGTTPIQARVRMVGVDPGIPAGTPVRLEGRTTVTAWARMERTRYVDAGVTITAANVTTAPNELPDLVGMLALRFHFPSGGNAVLVSQSHNDRPGEEFPYTATLMLPAGSVDGVANVLVRVNPAELLGSPVDADFLGRLVIPDQSDVGRNNKPDILVYANTLRPIEGASTYAPPASSRRRQAAEPNGDTAPTEETVS